MPDYKSPYTQQVEIVTPVTPIPVSGEVAAYGIQPPTALQPPVNTSLRGAGPAYNQVDADAVNGDSNNEATIALNVASYKYFYNPATSSWDRSRGDSTGGEWVQGNVANDAVDTGNPVKVGGRASSSSPVAVVTGDRVNLWLGLNGTTIVGGVNSSVLDGNSNSANYFGSSTGGLAASPCIGLLYNGATFDRVKKANAVSRIASSANSTNATLAKGSAGDIRGVSAVNTTGAVIYLKFCNSTANPPVPGTTAVFDMLAIPANSALNMNMPDNGLYCSTGIGYYLTTDAADAGTTAVAAGAIVGLSIRYD
jgi:hypothetical protein